MKEKDEALSNNAASKWVFFAVGCMATFALIFLIVDQRDKPGFGDAVYHTSGAVVTGFGIFGVMRWLERRRNRKETKEERAEPDRQRTTRGM